MVVLRIYSQVRGDWIRNLNLAEVAYKNVTQRAEGQIHHSAEVCFVHCLRSLKCSLKKIWLAR